MTQDERRARSRSALLESAARGLSRHGYGNLVLERVATDAGYTRGALYHLFQDKEALALAVVEWVNETWVAEVGATLAEDMDPVDELLALARGHAVYCRRDVARVRMMLAAEFAGQDHPVGWAVEQAMDSLVERCSRLDHRRSPRGLAPEGHACQDARPRVRRRARGRRDPARGPAAPRRGARRACRARAARRPVLICSPWASH